MLAPWSDVPLENGRLDRFATAKVLARSLAWSLACLANLAAGKNQTASQRLFRRPDLVGVLSFDISRLRKSINGKTSHGATGHGATGTNERTNDELASQRKKYWVKMIRATLLARVEQSAERKREREIAWRSD